MKVLLSTVTPITTHHKQAESIDSDELEPIGISPKI